MVKRRRIFTAPVEGEDGATGLQGSFPSRLNRAIMKKGWNQSELTRKMNDLRPAGSKAFGRHLVSAYVRGENVPQQGTLEIIAKALDVTLADLVPAEDMTVVGTQRLPIDVEFFDDDTWHVKVDTRLPSEVAAKVQKLVADAIRDMKERG